MITIGLESNCSLRPQKANGKEVTQDGNLSKLVLGAIAKFKKIYNGSARLVRRKGVRNEE